MAPILNFQCKKCRKVFNCDVGSVEVDEKTFRPVFGNKIVCPGCGELSHPAKEAKPYQVRDAKTFLENAGVKP